MPENIKAIILAGGMGLRIREVIEDLPKPMAPVNGRPFLEYLILQLKRWNVIDIILSTGYKGDIVKAYFDDGTRWGVNISYSEEQEPLGTGGALKRAAALINDDHFLAMNGDSFFDVDLDSLVDFHRRKKALATLALARVDDVARYGSVVAGCDGEVLGFKEKGPQGQGTINCGVYVIDRRVLDRFPAGRVSLENEVLPYFIGKGLFGLTIDRFFIDIGVPETYKKAQDLMPALADL